MTEVAARKAGIWTKLAYGAGAAANGIKNNGFEYFLLFYYSQVLGVDSALVGATLMIAMFVDGITDPIVGYWSDNLKTKLGRRHPFMYGAIIPVAVAYVFAWNPPEGMTGNALFPYLLMITILVRIAYTFYEVPSSALVAELTDDYDERTSFLSFRYVFGWTGGVAIAAYTLTFLLVETETYGSGFLNVEGYRAYGSVAAVAIVISMLLCAVGTHRQIPNLRKPQDAGQITLKRIFSEIGESLSNKSFQGLFVAALFGFMAAGVAASLNYYINGFFWEFTPAQTGLLTVSVFASAALALVLAPLISKRLGKKKGAIIVGAIGGVIVVFSIIFFDKIKIDDPVGAISVHGIVGIWGTLAVGIFGGAVFMTQLIGTLSVSLAAFIFSLIIFGILKVTIGIRVSAEEEAEGLDIAEHGQEAYPDFASSSS